MAINSNFDVDSIGGGGFGGGLGGNNSVLWLLLLLGKDGFGNNKEAGAGYIAGENTSKLDCLSQQHQTLMNQIAKNDTDQNFTTLGLAVDSLGNVQRDATAAVTNQINDLRAQAAECCCENRVAIQGVNTNIAMQTATLTASGLSNTQAILNKLCDNENAIAQSEIRRLQDALQTQTILANCNGGGNGGGNNIDINLLARAMQGQAQAS